MSSGTRRGPATDSEDTLRFARVTDVRPMIETMPPLERAAEAYETMTADDAGFRMVLTTGR